MTQRFCMALDLVDDADLIAEYERWHQVGRTPPGIIRSIRAAGIENMELYRAGNRMVMVIDAAEDFSFARKAALDTANTEVIAWERSEEHTSELQSLMRISYAVFCWKQKTII